MIDYGDIEWLEAHSARLYFKAGKKVAMEFRRPDGLIVQCSAFKLPDVIDAGRALANRPESPDGSNGSELPKGWAR